MWISMCCSRSLSFPLPHSSRHPNHNTVCVWGGTDFSYFPTFHIENLHQMYFLWTSLLQIFIISIAMVKIMLVEKNTLVIDLPNNCNIQAFPILHSCLNSGRFVALGYIARKKLRWTNEKQMFFWGCCYGLKTEKWAKTRQKISFDISNTVKIIYRTSWASLYTRVMERAVNRWLWIWDRRFRMKQLSHTGFELKLSLHIWLYAFKVTPHT